MSDLHTIKALIEDQGKAWADFKAENDERFDALEKKASRPNGLNTDDAGQPSANSPGMKTIRGAVHALLSGDQAKATSLFMEAKAMATDSDPNGGYVVHPAVSLGMTKVMAEISPLYRLSRRIPLAQGGVFEEPLDIDSAEANWVAERQSRADTETPDLGQFRVELHEICAMPKATQKLIDVAAIDVLAWLQEKVGDSFAVKEGTAFHSGDGVGKPRGILTYPTAATPDASRAWGTFEHIVTGASGAFHTTKGDPLIDLVAALKPQYRTGARWMMNRKTAAQIRKMKEATSDRYLWSDSLVAGDPPTLLGYGVEIDEDMPDLSADSLSVAFGNFTKGYTIVEQPGAKFLTDPYTDKPNVRLFAYRRVGGGVNNFEAIKYLKFST